MLFQVAQCQWLKACCAKSCQRQHCASGCVVSKNVGLCFGWCWYCLGNITCVVSMLQPCLAWTHLRLHGNTCPCMMRCALHESTCTCSCTCRNQLGALSALAVLNSRIPPCSKVVRRIGLLLQLWDPPFACTYEKLHAGTTVCFLGSAM